MTPIETRTIDNNRVDSNIRGTIRNRTPATAGTLAIAGTKACLGTLANSLFFANTQG